jgi:hypothetical protein
MHAFKSYVANSYGKVPPQHGWIQQAKDRKYRTPFEAPMCEAARNGQLECLRLFLDKDKFYYLPVAKAAVKGNQYSVLEFLQNYHVKEIFPWYSDDIAEGRKIEILEGAVSSGDLDMIRYLVQDLNYLQQLCELDRVRLMVAASSEGQRELIQTLRAYWPEQPSTDAPLLAALQNKHIELFYDFYHSGPVFDNPKLLLEAAKLGDLVLFQHLRNPDTGSGAVPYTRDAGAPGFAMPIGPGGFWMGAPVHIDVRDDVFDNVIYSSNEEFIDELLTREHILPNSKQFRTAAEVGYLPVMKQLCAANEDSFKAHLKLIFDTAAEYGAEELIQWMFRMYLDDLKPHLDQNSVKVVIESRLWTVLLFMIDPTNGLEHIPLNKLVNIFHDTFFKHKPEILEWFNQHREHEEALKPFYQYLQPYFQAEEKRAELDLRPLRPQNQLTIGEGMNFTFGTEVADHNLCSDLPPELQIPLTV